MSHRMYTMGREREKQLVRDSTWYGGETEPHFLTIDAFHDWNEGALPLSDVVERVSTLVDTRPTKRTLEVTTYWYRRAVEREPAFEGLLDRLGSHPRALVRIYALDETAEPVDDRTRQRYRRWLWDSALSVAASAVSVAYYRRWVSVQPLIEERMTSLEAQHRDDWLQKVAFIRAGHYWRGDLAWYYSGRGPGGAGSITSAPASNIPPGLLERISRDELLYLQREGGWPMRPARYFGIQDLADWRPNASTH